MRLRLADYKVRLKLPPLLLQAGPGVSERDARQPDAVRVRVSGPGAGVPRPLLRRGSRGGGGPTPGLCRPLYRPLQCTQVNFTIFSTKITAVHVHACHA